MAANDDDFIGCLTPCYICNHVARIHFAQKTGGEGHLHANRLTAGRHSLQLIRIGVGECSRRNSRVIRVVTHRTRMGHAMAVSAYGANHQRRRPFAGSDTGSFPAQPSKVAVMGAVLGAAHSVADIGDFPLQAALGGRLQGTQAGEECHLSLNACLVGGD